MLRADRRACRQLRPMDRVRLQTHRTGEFINFDQGSTFDHRKAIFTYLGLALKYRWLILTFCTVALGIGFFVTFTSTPIYRATVSVQIDRQAPRVVKTDTQPDFGDDSDRFYQTQYDLLRSRMLAERVASDLNLASAPDFLDPPSSSPWRKLRSLISPAANTGLRPKTSARRESRAEKSCRGRDGSRWVINGPSERLQSGEAFV